MKRLLLMCFMFVIAFVMVGCSNESETLNNLYLNEILIKTENINTDIACKPSLITYYYNTKYSNYSVYECKKSNNSKYLAGYLDYKTIELLDNLENDNYDNLDKSYYISGIDGYLRKYQNAIMNGIFNEKEHYIEYKYIDENQIKILNKDQRLVVVLKENLCKVENINAAENKEIFIYSNVDGIIENEEFYLKDELTSHNSLEHFLYISKEIADFYIEEEMMFTAIQIHNNEYIEEAVNEILNYKEYEEYFNNIKKYIISENKELVNDKLLKYDYIGVKSILKGE